MNIRIDYDGKWPCLCMGHLKVWIDEKKWDFGENVLNSGGTIERDDDWNMWADKAIIEKACEWLKDNIFNYPWYDNDAPNFTIDDIINDFRKAMEE